ncbi:MAG: hypothetical protein ACRCUS_04345 [Anaerovoracaceae bacterium]
MNRIELEKIILELFNSLEKNNFGVLGKPDSPMWEKPLIGVSKGDDELFDFYKEHIGEFHWSPEEAFRLKYNDENAGKINKSKLRVISMIFPQTKETKDMQEKKTKFPCDNWLVSRGEWEPLMKTFSSRLVKALEEKDIKSVSIDLQPEFQRERSEKLGIASRWSHRHYAYAAGLGTFGLSDGFISEKGKAVRITSLIIQADIEANDRGEVGPYDWCLYYKDGSCGACIPRCPIGCISKEGHDKYACAGYEDFTENTDWPKHIKRGDYIFGCGLCQVKIPCRDKKPE